jgi:hypothetical protein
MARANKLAKFMGGCAAAGIVALGAASTQPATAAGSRALRLLTINVANGANVPANQIIELTFSDLIDPTSVSPATLFVRGINATGTGYTKQVFGSSQVAGRVVRFYPRLPTHLRDANNKFYPAGSALDDAGANAGLQPSTKYLVLAVGKSSITTIRSSSGKALRSTYYTRFQTASSSPPETLWTTQSYSDQPPPQFSFSNPPDTVPSPETQYATHGGTQDVPSSITMSLFCTKVPLAPGTARNSGNVSMTMLARNGNYALRRPVAGSVFVEQNFDTTLLAFQPTVALADLGIYSLRVNKGVKDLTEQNDFASNRDRDRLNHIYAFLSAARSLAPTVPVSQLPDPGPELVPDWPKLSEPGAVAARGVLKQNVLALGDAYSDEIDPRTMLICTTRDEPVTQDAIITEFTKGENLYDGTLSIGTVDKDVPSAAAAVFTASGGTAALGDLVPAGSITVNAGSNPQGLNYRNIVIPAGVTVTLAGGAVTSPPTQAARTFPVTIKCLTFQLDGQIVANGSNGVDGPTNTTYSTLTTIPSAGGPGGPGGGNGGNTTSTITANTRNGTGDVGNDGGLVPATAAQGGRGGQGGAAANSTAYGYGGGGGGGGQRTAGANGANATCPTNSTTWNGVGGAGGAASTGNTDLAVLVGGAGGGGGGNGNYPSQSWGNSGGSGGGGGGALLVQTAGTLTISATGAVRARGGAGGAGGTTQVYNAGGGGGGSGGAVLLRSSRGFNLAAATTAIDVAGGAAGKGTNAGGLGGAGGLGFARFEDPTGGLTVPGATQGIYSPVGGGVPSYVYTRWQDFGVQDPRLLPWKAADIISVTSNDAIYVQAQMTKENIAIFGTPDTSAVNKVDQSSNNVTITSQWQPIKVHDTSAGALTPAFGTIPGYPAGPPTEFTGFSVAPFNNKGYRFIRYRIFFQLDATQTATSPVPYVDKIITNFQYNF